MRSLAAVPVIVVLAVLTGCGGGDGSSSRDGSPKALTKAQYIARADDVCRANQKQLEPIERDLRALPTDDDGRGETKRIEPILERALAATRDGYERLRELPVPAQGKATVERWLASTARSIEAFEGVLQAVRADDREDARAPSERVDTLSTEQRRLARSYGFKACLSAASTD